MTTTYPAPGSSAPGAPPPLRRQLAAADGCTDVAPSRAEAGSPMGPGTDHPQVVHDATTGTERIGLLVGLGLAVAALVVELSGRRREHRP